MGRTGGDCSWAGPPPGGAAAAIVAAQFVPIQRRLAELDLLNEWTTPIGFAVFAIQPGTREAGFIGETLLG